MTVSGQRRSSTEEGGEEARETACASGTNCRKLETMLCSLLLFLKNNYVKKNPCLFIGKEIADEQKEKEYQ